MRVARVPKPTNESCWRVQGLDVLSDVIYHLETFDVTTIRASTPMFLLARRIKVSFEVFFF
jgi:asparagine synthetase B (glutamine-hydrolysing)